MVNRRQTLATLAAGTASALGAPALAAPSKDEKRAEVRKMAQETLAKLYSLQPAAKKAIASSAGYAVFSNFGMKILVAGGGSGDGVAASRYVFGAIHRRQARPLDFDGASPKWSI